MRGRHLAYIIMIALQQATALSQEAPRSTLPQEEIDKCLAASERNVAALQNVEIHYFNKVDFATPRLAISEEDCQMILNRGRMLFRYKRAYPGKQRSEKEIEENAYDGSIFYAGGNGANATVYKILGERSDTTMMSWQYKPHRCHYLEAAGYQLPQRAAQWKGKGDAPLTSIVVAYLKEGEIVGGAVGDSRDPLMRMSVLIPDPTVLFAQKTDLDAYAEENRNTSQIAEIIRQIEQLRTSDRRRRIDLWLDAEKDYAVVRRFESTADGKMIYQMEAQAFEKYGGRIWLPKSCVIRTFVRDEEWVSGFQPEPDRFDSIELKDVRFEPRNDVSFVIDYGPGTHIMDWSSEAGRSQPDGYLSYDQPASLGKLRDAADQARQTTRWRAIVVVNVVLGLMLVALAVRRYARR